MKARTLAAGIGIALLGFGGARLVADEPIETSENSEADKGAGEGELNLPWAAFQKLLRLDQDNVLLGWNEFQRLLEQAGMKTAPPFQMQKGQVSLSREEFGRLLQRMTPPSTGNARCYMTQALYTGRVSRKGTTITGTIRAHVVSEGAYVPVTTRLFPQNLAMENVLLDGRPALVDNDGGGISLTFPQPGEHAITATFSLPEALDKEPYRLSFPVPQTPMTQVDIVLEAPGLEIRMDGLPSVTTLSEKDGTRLRMSIPQTDRIGWAWNPVTPDKAKGPAKVYAVDHTVLGIEDDVVRVTSRVEITVLQNTIQGLSFILPEGYSLLDVTGEAVGEWKKRGEDERSLIVPLEYPRKGTFFVDLRLERALKEGGAVVPFEGIQLAGAVRESGDVLVESSGNGEVRVTDPHGLIRLDPREISPPLRSLSSRTFLDAYKFIRPPYKLALDIQRHEEVPVVSSVVDTANAVTLYMKDGKCVTQVTYSVKNSAKQYLELRLPPGSEVWSAFVEGRPVKPTKKERSVLVPMPRSAMSGEELTSFDVEVMYFQILDKVPLAGIPRWELPGVDLKVSKTMWSVYLPTDLDVIYFGGSVDKEREAEGWNPLLSVVKGRRRILSRLGESASQLVGDVEGLSYAENKIRRKDVARQSAQYNQVLSEFKEDQGVGSEDFAQQVERELNFLGNVNRPSAGSGGMSPNRISVPNSGQVYRFSQWLLQENEQSNLSAVAMAHVMLATLKGLIFLIALYFALRLRRPLKAGWQRAGAFIDRHGDQWGWLKTPPGLGAFLFAAGIVLTFYVGKFLGMLAVLGSVFCLGWWGWATLLKSRRRS